MSGKKGRSGRKKKVPNVPAGKLAPVPAQNSSVESPVENDFKAIEQRLEAELPVIPQNQSPDPAPGELSAKKMPEKTVRLFWSCVYKLEDGIIRRYLGLGNDVKGIFCENDLIESHVQPSCELLKQYVPAQYWDNLDSKFPIAMLGFSILEAQLAIFDKIGEIKAEKSKENPQQAPQKPAASGNSPYDNFPRRS